MQQRKCDRMAAFQPDLDAVDVQYKPFVVSCWGRLHPDADRMLQTLANRAARREGLPSSKHLLHQYRSRITTEVMRRAARMVMRCMPDDEAAADVIAGRTHAIVQPPLPHHLR